MYLSVIAKDEIRVYESAVRTLFDGIGEGVYSVEANSFDIADRWVDSSDEIQNEVIVTLIDNASGNISLSEWNRVEGRLTLLKTSGVICDYVIDTNKNIVTLEFERNLQMGLY